MFEDDIDLFDTTNLPFKWVIWLFCYLFTINKQMHNLCMHWNNENYQEGFFYLLGHRKGNTIGLKGFSMFYCFMTAIKSYHFCDVPYFF